MGDLTPVIAITSTAVSAARVRVVSPATVTGSWPIRGLTMAAPTPSDDAQINRARRRDRGGFAANIGTFGPKNPAADW